MPAKVRPPIAPRGRLLPASQAAVRIGIGIDALRAVIHAGTIAVMRHDSGRLMGIYERDCDAWVELRRTRATETDHEPSRLAVQHVDQVLNAMLTDEEREMFG